MPSSRADASVRLVHAAVIYQCCHKKSVRSQKLVWLLLQVLPSSALALADTLARWRPGGAGGQAACGQRGGVRPVTRSAYSDRPVLIVLGRGTNWPLPWPRPFRRQRGRFAYDAVRLVARTVVAVLL